MKHLFNFIPFILSQLHWLSPVCAQNPLLDSVISLKEFSFEANRYTQTSPGQKSEKLDSSSIKAPIAQNLSDLLVQSNSFFIKTYGLGGLSTGSFRGSSASQTATLWNGFNLQSPMNGVLDYSLVPTFFLDEVNLSYGGASSLFGSGSVGGTVLLNNSVKFNTGLTASVSGSIGSFNDYQEGLKIGWSNSKIGIHARIFKHTASNDYPFINTAEIGHPKQFQQNAKLKQSGLLLENYIQLNQQQLLSFRFWYQHSDRQIPAAITSEISVQNQQDEFYRGSVEWNYKLRKNKLTARAAYFDEQLNFNDASISLYSYSRSRTLIAEAENTYFFSANYYLTVGINNTSITALSDGYSQSEPTQNRTAAFAAFQSISKNKSWKNKVSVRKEYYGNSQVPLTASFGTEKLFLKFLNARGNVSRNYRLPTFNDLFWNEQGASGNPNLKPESGWSGDIGVGEKICTSKYSVESEVSIFSSQVKDMIVWQPDATGIWSPQNISSIVSRGLEVYLKSNYSFKAISLFLNAKYNHTLSTIKEQNNSNVSTEGNQLFYVPMDSYQIEVSAVFKGFKLSYIHNYTGKRFTNNENTEYLKAFQLGNVKLSKVIQIKKIQLVTYFQVNNCWNEQYQAIAWRPMPMTNYMIGLSIGF